jgi:hypothetical protein
MNVRDAFYEILRTHGITTIAAAYGVQSERVKSLADLTRAVKDGVVPRAGELPDDEALKPVTDAVRPVLAVLGPGPQPARPGATVA